MQSIIRQNGHHRPALPDFRNLGTVLRTLVAVNAGAALYALAREPSPARWFAELSVALGVAEPYLFLVLAILWLASPRLSRLPYDTGAGIVVLVTILAGIVVWETRHILAPLPSGAVLFAWLSEQANPLALAADISPSVVQITQGVVVLAVVIAYEVVRRWIAAYEQRELKAALETEEAAA